MGIYAANVIEIPQLRYRARVFRDHDDAAQRLAGLAHAIDLLADTVVYAGEADHLLARSVASALQLPCLKLGSGIRELVRGREVLLVFDALDSLDSAAAAVDWLLAFKVDRLDVMAASGHRHVIDPLAPLASKLICPNIRCSWNFDRDHSYQQHAASANPVPA